VVVLGSSNATYSQAQHRIRDDLKGKGFEGTDAYDAVNWAVFGKAGMEAIGVDPLVAEGWTCGEKRLAVPTAMAAAKRVLNGGSVDKAAIAGALKRHGNDGRRGWGDAAQIASRVPIERVVGPYNRHPRVDAMILKDAEWPGKSFLLLYGSDENMILVRQDISSSIEVVGELDVMIPQAWLEEVEEEEIEE
jgi:hypothetical protein